LATDTFSSLFGMGRKNSTNADAKREPLSRKERRQLKEQSKKEDMLQELSPLLHGLLSDDEAERLESLRKVSAMLEDHETASGVLAQADVVQAVLSQCEQPETQFLALQALMRLAIADAQKLTDHGVADILLPLIASGGARTREQALSICALLAASSVGVRDHLVERSALKVALDNVSVQDAGQPSPVTQKMAAFLCKVCAWDAPLAIGEDGGRLVNALAVLSTSNDEEVLLNALKALSHLEFRNEDHLVMLLRHAHFERLIFLFEQPCVEICSWAARVAHKAAFGSVIGMQAFLLQEPIPALKELLDREEPEAHREACAIFADILSVGGAHVQEVVGAGCLPRLAELLREGPEDVKQVAVRAFAALSLSCTPQRLQALIDEGVAASAVALLHPEAAPQTVRPALRFLEGVMKCGLYLQEQSGLVSNRFAEAMKAAGAVEKLRGIAGAYDDKTACLRALAISQALTA